MRIKWKSFDEKVLQGSWWKLIYINMAQEPIINEYIILKID